MKKNKKSLQYFLSFLFILTVISPFLKIINVNAENIIKDPYIDITFDEIAKENKGHGTLKIFSNNESGNYAYYGNSAISYGINAFGTYMTWTSNKSNGGGFNLNVDKTIGEDYTIALKFSFTNTGEKDYGYKKIIDFQKNYPNEDSGFYFYNGGKIMFYPKSSLGTAVKNNEVVDLLVRRNGSTKKFEVYNRIGENSVLCYEFTDTEGLSILGSSLGFFHDDLATQSEATEGGKVYSVKLWDSYLDVDDVWKALDEEKENSISKYVCRKIEKKEPTEIIPGWETYFECKDKTDGSYKFFEDEDLKEVIEDIDIWKKDEGYISQTKSFEEIITDLENKIDGITESNVNSNNKTKLDAAKNIIDNIDIEKASIEEKEKINTISEKSKTLIKIIDETKALLKEFQDAVENYSNKELTSEDKFNIKTILTKRETVKKYNLTDEEKEQYNSNVQILKNLVSGDYTYIFLKGDNQKLEINDIKEYALVIDGDYSLFENLKISDLDLVENDDYIVTEGSTIITFTENGIKKLNTLTKGEYEITVKYTNNKEVKGKLILNNIRNPKTGDNLNLYIIIGIISLLGIIGILYIKKTINKTKNKS